MTTLTPLDQLEALRDEPLHLLPPEALIASLRQLATEMIAERDLLGRASSFVAGMADAPEGRLTDAQMVQVDAARELLTEIREVLPR